MIFPFSIRYSVRLSDHFFTNRNKEALKYIESYITSKKGKDIVIDDDRLTFKSKFFTGRSNGNILVPIEKGIFTIVDKGDQVILTYEFYMYRLFIVVAIMSVFMAISANRIWIGILCFLWLCGMNWLLTLIRHRRMLKKIAMAIDILCVSANSVVAPVK